LQLPRELKSASWLLLYIFPDQNDVGGHVAHNLGRLSGARNRRNNMNSWILTNGVCKKLTTHPGAIGQ
jgi:hypothetical protein